MPRRADNDPAFNGGRGRLCRSTACAFWDTVLCRSASYGSPNRAWSWWAHIGAYRLPLCSCPGPGVRERSDQSFDSAPSRRYDSCQVPSTTSTQAHRYREATG